MALYNFISYLPDSLLTIHSIYFVSELCKFNIINSTYWMKSYRWHAALCPAVEFKTTHAVCSSKSDADLTEPVNKTTYYVWNCVELNISVFSNDWSDSKSTYILRVM